MSAKTGALQCLQQAIAQIQHAVGTRTWFCIHELRGDDQQQHQTLNLRHHLGLSSSTQYDVLLHEVGYNIGKKGMRHKWESLNEKYDIASRTLLGKKQLFIKLGRSNDGAFPNVEQQVKCISFMMPRLSSSEMNELRKKLRHFANVLIADAPIQGAVEMASDTVPENHNQEESMSRDTQEETHVAKNDETDRTVTPPITEIESVANIFRDATQMSDAVIQALHFRLFQELKRPSGMDRLPSFTLKAREVIYWKEETVKRIKSDEVRAKSKAMQGCISNDSGVQSAIKEIHASMARGPYKKRKENPSNETETTPPPPAVCVRPLVTNEASDSSPSLQQANDLEAQQQSWISSAPHYSPHRSTQ